jgi:hypothetical protein
MIQETMIKQGGFEEGVMTKARNVMKGYGMKNFDKAFAILFERFLTLSEPRLQPNTTFRELYASTQNDLFITGTNVTKKRLEVFSHYTTPNMKVMDAVEISMSASPVFRYIEREGDVYTDGAYTLAYPTTIFLEPSTVFEQYESRVDLQIDYANLNNPRSDNHLLFPGYKHTAKYNNSIKKRPEQVLGMMINVRYPSNISNIKDFFTSLVTVITTRETMMLPEAVIKRTIQITHRSPTSVFEFSTEANAEFVLLGEKAYRDAS